MKALFVSLAILASVLAAFAGGDEAPLGLSWGATSEALTQSGISLKETGSDAYGVGFVASKLSKALSDQDATYLSFGYDDKLWRIVVVSRDFSNDPMGIAVKNRYSELLNILTEKYGKPKNYHVLGDSIYAQPRYFLAGIQGGNSFWYSNFSTPVVDIQIGIIATTSSDSRWRIIYEFKPLRSLFDQSKRVREKKSL